MTTTASATQDLPTLSFPASTFAKLSPHPYLLAHLSQNLSKSTRSTRSTTSISREEASAPSIRPNGRTCSEFRTPHVNTGSLTHAEGSAVVRCGDTTAVAGVRGEILLASDTNGATEMKDLDLLVPNIELATGCSPQFMPGQPPSTLAQGLSTRVYSLLHSSRLVDFDDLKIWYAPPDVFEEGDVMEENSDGEGGGGKAVVKAYWTLYIDILFISLDGNPFDAAWAAVLAALRDVRLPSAYWDIDAEMILCSDEVSESKTLNLRGLPVACTFVVFTAGQSSQGVEEKSGKRQWILADPDTFEEGLCDESVTVVVDCSRGSQGERTGTRLLGISKVGGTGIGRTGMRQLVEMAEKRWVDWERVFVSGAEGKT